MKLHGNARTCPNCRRFMVRQVIDEGRPARVLASDFGVSERTLYKWLRRFRLEGPRGLIDRSSAPHSVPRRYPQPSEELKKALFATLHSPPKAFGFNRTTWRMGDLLAVLRRRGFVANLAMIRKLIRDAGYRWRKARVVLTSNDCRFREKVDRVRKILCQLKENEAFFSIDEFGPFAIRLRGGRALVPPGQLRAVPQWQRSKGSLIVVAALELASNQVTHFYSKRKKTGEMIRMLTMLCEQYAARKRIFVSWDAAPWHRSRELFEYLAEQNANAAREHRPVIEVAPLPGRAQFLNVIESVFSGMARAIVHNSNYPSVAAAQTAIDLYFAERNEHYRRNPRRAGNKIWGHERVPSAFAEVNNCKDPRYS